MMATTVKTNSTVTPTRARHLTEHAQRFPFILANIVDANVIQSHIISLCEDHVVSTSVNY